MAWAAESRRDRAEAFPHLAVHASFHGLQEDIRCPVEGPHMACAGCSCHRYLHTDGHYVHLQMYLDDLVIKHSFPILSSGIAAGMANLCA